MYATNISNRFKARCLVNTFPQSLAGLKVQHGDILSLIKEQLIFNKYSDNSLIIQGNIRTGKTTFLKDFINHLRENNQKICVFTGGNDLSIESYVSPHDKQFNPWSNEEFKIPSTDFAQYQNKTIPILNDFIRNIDIDENFGLFINYPLAKDSEGNRFVLDSLIQVALNQRLGGM